MPVPREPAYIPKRAVNDAEPWISFGSDRLSYEKWIPEVCGICCLKMIGDTFGITNEITLFEITGMAIANGTFVVGPGGAVAGAYHRPLAELFESFGFDCEVVGSLDSARLLDVLGKGSYAILSIDMSKLVPGKVTGHLVLVYGYDGKSDEFLLHDCSSVIQPDGRGVKLDRATLEGLSNRKGLTVAPQRAVAP